MSYPPYPTGHIVDDNGCHIWQGPLHPQGYGVSCHELAHRTAWQKQFGPIPQGMNVLHKCDVKLCINTDHLFLGTQKDNLVDMSRKGRWKNQTTKLTWEDVHKMREFRLRGYKQEQLVQMFGVSQAQVSRIVNNVAWR